MLHTFCLDYPVSLSRQLLLWCPVVIYPHMFNPEELCSSEITVLLVDCILIVNLPILLFDVNIRKHPTMRK
jgi:hypothetical protein